jgi:uncharacterized protein with HEPN domain
MSKREPKLLLEDILISSERIIAYTHSLTFEEFASDSKTIDAVVRNIEIIGEASNYLVCDRRLSTQISCPNTRVA